MIRLAIPKGRLMENCLDRLADVYNLDEIKVSNRQLSYKIEHKTNKSALAPTSIFIIRNSDIITYIKNNMADLALIGSDMIKEDDDRGKNYYDYGDTGFGTCRLMNAARASSGTAKADGDMAIYGAASKKLRVASKYEKITKEFYANRGIQIEFIKIRGSVELAAANGFVDHIVDIVASGKTLKDNNLISLEKIMDVSSRLIINKKIMKTKWNEISAIADKILTPS